MTVTKKYAIRRKNGKKSIVQVKKTSTGTYKYSDRKQCKAKLYKTKAMATSALKRQCGGFTVKRSKSSFGKKRRTRRRSKKDGKLKKYYVPYLDPEDREKIKVFPAYRFKWGDIKYQIVKVGSGMDMQAFLLPEDTKLSASRATAKKKVSEANLLMRAKVFSAKNLISIDQLGELGISVGSGGGLQKVRTPQYKTQMSNSAVGIPRPFSPYQNIIDADIGNKIERPKNRQSIYGGRKLALAGGPMGLNPSGTGGTRAERSKFEKPSFLYNFGMRRPMARRPMARRPMARPMMARRPMGSRFGSRVNYGFSRYF